jgi:hypothetical protein
LQLAKSKQKKEKKGQVLEIGKKIETWVVKRKPVLSKYLEFTNRTCDFVKQKTDIELPLVVAKVFIGVGNMIINHHDKVFNSVIIVARENIQFIPYRTRS